MKKGAVRHSRKKIGFKTISFILVMALLSFDWETFMSLPTVVNLTNGDFKTVAMEGRKSVNTFMIDVKDQISTSKDNMFTFLEETSMEDLKKVIQVKFIGSNDVNKNNDDTTRNRKKERKLQKKEILENLRKSAKSCKNLLKKLCKTFYRILQNLADAENVILDANICEDFGKI